MKPLKLPNNKLARLAINIGFVPVWFLVSDTLNFSIVRWVLHNTDWIYPGQHVFLITFLIPIVLATRYIWWGRLKPRPRITRSKDD